MSKLGKRYIIRIDVPQWLWRWRYENWRKWIRAKLNPIKCECCGVKLAFKNAQYTVAKPRLTVQKCSGTLCRSCMEKDIHAIIAEGPQMHEWEVKHTCDSCGSNTPSFKGLYRAKQQDPDRPEFLNRYYHCINSWNGSHVCVGCMIEVIRNGKEESNVRDWSSGKDISVNEQGLPVIDGKPRFPLW